MARELGMNPRELGKLQGGAHGRHFFEDGFSVANVCCIGQPLSSVRADPRHTLHQCF